MLVPPTAMYTHVPGLSSHGFMRTSVNERKHNERRTDGRTDVRTDELTYGHGQNLMHPMPSD